MNKKVSNSVRVLMVAMMLAFAFLSGCVEKIAEKSEDQNAHVKQFNNAVTEVGELRKMAARLDDMSVLPEDWTGIREKTWEVLDWAEKQRGEGIALLSLDKPNHKALSIYTSRLASACNQNVMDKLVALNKKTGGE